MLVNKQDFVTEHRRTLIEERVEVPQLLAIIEEHNPEVRALLNHEENRVSFSTHNGVTISHRIKTVEDNEDYKRVLVSFSLSSHTWGGIKRRVNIKNNQLDIEQLCNKILELENYLEEENRKNLEAQEIANNARANEERILNNFNQISNVLARVNSKGIGTNEENEEYSLVLSNLTEDDIMRVAEALNNDGAN